MDFQFAIQTTLLLVDDDTHQLELRAIALKLAGFSVLIARCPAEAIETLAHPACKVDVGILDYQMPGMNGCVLADYLRLRYPKLKIILHSAVVEIPEAEMGNVDVFVPKGHGIRALLTQLSELTRGRPAPGAPVFGRKVYAGS